MKPYTLFKRRGGDRDTAIWYVRVMEDGQDLQTGQPVRVRKAYSTGCNKKDDAEDYAELHFGSGKRAPTLDAFIEDRHFFERGACRWIQRREAGGHELTENTLKVYRHALGMIKKAFGARRLSEIRLKDLEIWILGLGCASSTKSVVMSVLRVLLREAVRDELIKEDPTKQLEPLKIKRMVRGVFNMAELGRLFPPDRAEFKQIWGGQLYATFFLTMATAGLRNSETRALQWRHYLRAERALLVEQQAQRGGITHTKGKRDRLVLIPDRTCAELDQWHESTLYGELDDFMFPNANGAPYGMHAPQDWLRGALPRAEIDPAGRVLVVHSFRHTYVTHVRRSVPAQALGEMIGHSNEATTDGYDHPSIAQRLEALGVAREGIGRFLPR